MKSNDVITCRLADDVIICCRFTNSMQLNIMLSLFAEEIASFVVKVPLISHAPLFFLHLLFQDHSVLSERPTSSRGESSGKDLILDDLHPLIFDLLGSAPRSRPMLRNFNAKLRSFYRRLAEKGYGQGPTKIK